MKKGRKNQLLEKKEVLEKLDTAVDKAQEITKGEVDVNDRSRSIRTLSASSISRLLGSKEIQNIMNSILDTSTLADYQKEYLRAIFYQDYTQAEAYELVKHKKPENAQQAEQLKQTMMNTPAVKDFVELMRLFYLRAVPIAALKQVEMIMNKDTKDGVRIEAIKDIQDRAGIVAEGKSVQLPVNVHINIQQNQQNNEEKRSE